MDVYVGRWDEERVIKWMAVGMVLAMVGLMISQEVVESQVVYYITQSEVMGAAATTGSAAIIAAAITKSSLTGLALLGAAAGGIGVAIAVGL